MVKQHLCNYVLVLLKYLIMSYGLFHNCFLRYKLNQTAGKLR